MIVMPTLGLMSSVTSLVCIFNFSKKNIRLLDFSLSTSAINKCIRVNEFCRFTDVHIWFFEKKIIIFLVFHYY